MATIQLKTPIPGPKSKALAARRESALPRGLSHATPVYIAKAEGAVIEDVDGNRFIDFTGGIGCVNVGHRAPEVVEGLQKQLDRFCTSAYKSPRTKAISNSPSSRMHSLRASSKKTFLLNTGAEAVENAIKIATCPYGPAGNHCIRGCIPWTHHNGHGAH